MMEIANNRRQFWQFGSAALTGALLGPTSLSAKEAKEVGAVEDLMREHGVLRRALLVYDESANRLQAAPRSVDASALNRTAKLFRAFGEDYHEHRLEETHIFPRVKKAGGMAATYVNVLLAQHKRGREITQYILDATARSTISVGNVEPLAGAFRTFVRMYENHAAREDTIVFPAWKDALSESALHELGETFEDIEKQQFGDDGFEKAVKEISEIEHSLGFSDLAQFTAPPPPRVR
jgi:hemerythrin-like domain-containing protein